MNFNASNTNLSPISLVLEFPVTWLPPLLLSNPLKQTKSSGGSVQHIWWCEQLNQCNSWIDQSSHLQPFSQPGNKFKRASRASGAGSPWTELLFTPFSESGRRWRPFG